jgi:succinylarginine dihydrolase
VMREYNFDGLVGPTHNYGGLAPGNEASIRNQGRVSNPRMAALQGLAKMRFVHDLGVGQALLPPPARPDLPTLRRLGFAGPDEAVLARVAGENNHLLRLCASSSSMWAANAATVAPSSDTSDRRVHFLPANLTTMFHRAIEADSTTTALRAIFAKSERFLVHDPLPAGAAFADEGAANHTRLETAGRPAVHLFAWGRQAWGSGKGPTRYPARQTLEASAAAARLLQLEPSRVFLPQQDPAGIDAGAFHTDVLAVGHRSFLMLHELAFADGPALMAQLRALLGDELSLVLATDAELPVADAVAAYPFNSMVVTLPSGKMAVLAPIESRDTPAARRFLDRVVATENPVASVHYLDVGQSMNNGGGPACLRLRVPLSDEEAEAVRAAVFYTPERGAAWEAWVTRHYRDRLTAADLADPALWREVMTALDELTQLLGLPSLYPFQQR